MSVDFYVEPGAEVKITGNDYLTGNWTVKSKVKDQKIYQSYIDEVDELVEKLAGCMSGQEENSYYR